MQLTALVIAVVACVGIIALGARFVLAPRPAMLGFGVAPDRLRAMTEAKGVRDITSGVLLLVVWAAAGYTTLGWFMVAVALTPVADAAIVLANGGEASPPPSGPRAPAAPP